MCDEARDLLVRLHKASNPLDLAHLFVEAQRLSVTRTPSVDFDSVARQAAEKLSRAVIATDQLFLGV